MALEGEMVDAASTAAERRMIMPKNVVCKKCNNLVNDWCEKVIDSPDQDIQRDCRHFREKTNADRIRSMSDEELAEMLWKTGRNYRSVCADPVVDYNEHRDHLIAWLKQPAE